MEAILLVAVVILIGAVFFLIWMVAGAKNAPKDDRDHQAVQLLQNQIQDMARTLDSRLSETSREVHQTVRTQLGESARLIREVTEGLTKLDETNRQVVSFADQLQSLQDVLKNPKQRGILGEYYLETLLKNVLPPGQYAMQYAFPSGDIVDAAVFVKDKVIPIDSKFSLENYNRLVEAKEPAERSRLEKLFENDLKNRIIETAKYIRPQDGTMDFAFMFIPHEAIYYDLLLNKVGAVSEENLIQRAAAKYKVIIVSPTSFLAYLQTVLQGLRAMQIEETAKDIIKRVDELGKHLKTYGDYHLKLGNTLATAVNQYNATGKEFGKIDKDILRITGEKAELETIAIEKPMREEE